jgi:hypothetical protein
MTEKKPDPDELYALLVDAHRDLDAEASAALNARLVLLLADRLGDLDAVKAAVAAAKRP